MKKFTQVLQIVLLVFFAAMTIFFVAFDTLGGLFGTAEISSDQMVKIMLTGLIIFLITWLSAYLTIKGLSDSLTKKEIEMNKLKAKLYDLEHPDIPQKKPEQKKEGSEPTANPSPSE
ncbi:hypothetical protein ACFOSV_08500 [Algoriphagus namhaensis]|uniref:LapA family protein n=1 Tax=Algoriphagus namhaensis TaxID=915353 RepID=A0ABV8AQF8_9BACT